MGTRYPTTIYNEIKQLFIQQDKSSRKISEMYEGAPSHQTIEKWARDTNKAGKTWYDLKEDWREEQYNAITPKAMATKILQKISDEMSADHFSADRLAKLVAALNRITEASYQIPAMYEMLTDLLSFIKSDFPHLLTEDLVAAIREFRNKLRDRLGS